MITYGLMLCPDEGDSMNTIWNVHWCHRLGTNMAAEGWSEVMVEDYVRRCGGGAKSLAHVISAYRAQVERS